MSCGFPSFCFFFDCYDEVGEFVRLVKWQVNWCRIGVSFQNDDSLFGGDFVSEVDLADLCTFLVMQKDVHLLECSLIRCRVFQLTIQVPDCVVERFFAVARVNAPGRIVSGLGLITATDWRICVEI